MKKKRIVVTGMGVVSCFGDDVDTFYDSLLSGKSGVSTIEEFDVSSYPTKIAASIKNFAPLEKYVSSKVLRRMDHFTSYTLVAGKKALEHAGFSLENISLDPKRTGVIVGAGIGGMRHFYDGTETLLQKGYRKLSPFFVPSIITNMGGALLAIEMGFLGPVYSISTACATSNYCIVAAAEQIMLGNADVMLCGGSEAPMNPIGLAGFVVAHALSKRNDEPQRASRPWDKGRDGFVMGEGSAVLVLEELEHALARKAPILAEYLGGAVNCDGYHMTDPRPEGEIVANCMQMAIDKAGIAKEEINYINAHATSTIAGDLCEVRAIKKVFSNHCKNIKMNATKSMIGHCLGAAGGMEAIACVQAIKRGMLHPTINLENPEEELGDLDPVAQKAKACKVSAALSSSFGFGGHNSAIIFGPYHG